MKQDNMISQQTAARIFDCYREIAASKNLLKQVEAEVENRKPTAFEPDGHPRQSFQLGVPMDRSSHRIFRLEPQLGVSIIRAHIAAQMRELVEANEQARVELSSAKDSEWLKSATEED